MQSFSTTSGGGGILTYGYLGVDIFFVISGYFMMKGISKGLKDSTFNYWNYLKGRIARLWPSVLIVAVISLIIGYFVMLPDDLENLSESVIASNVFANNILACITTKNYWDIVNVFKPLMHTWYIAVLMQAYVVLPIIYLVVFKLSKRDMNAVKISVGILTLVSLLVYLLPVATSAEKFYYLPFRTFEITLGNLMVFIQGNKLSGRATSFLKYLCLAVLLLLLCANVDVPAASIKLLIIVFATALLLYLFAVTEDRTGRFIKIFSCVGRASFSIYLCHQVVVAFMYYAVTDQSDWKVLLLFLVVVGILSVAFYCLIEKPIRKLAKKNIWYVLAPSIVLCIITSAASGMIYLHAGVVRDVPELGIDKTDVHRGMHAEYCDIPYFWDKDFESTDKVKIAVIGDSFGRDWANILNESAISDEIEISYIYARSQETYQEIRECLDEADVVFRCISSPTLEVSDNLQAIVPEDKLYIVGYKNFGSSNGIIYSHRNSADYFEQTVQLSDEVLQVNRILGEEYGDHYIDMIGVVQEEDSFVRVFTDDHKFISQDCRHLTKYGAQYYARILDLEWIVEAGYY